MPVVSLAGLVVVTHEAFSTAPVVEAILQSMTAVRCRPRQAPDDQLDNAAVGSYDLFMKQQRRPLLTTMPPPVTMLPETPRAPYPITWDEQDKLFSKLPARLGRMVLCAVNTGLLGRSLMRRRRCVGASRAATAVQMRITCPPLSACYVLDESVGCATVREVR